MAHMQQTVGEIQNILRMEFQNGLTELQTVFKTILSLFKKTDYAQTEQFLSILQYRSVQGKREEVTLVLVTMGQFSYRKEKEEMAINGLLLALLALAMYSHISISLHSTQGCFHLLTGLRKLCAVSTLFCPQTNTEHY